MATEPPPPIFVLNSQDASVSVIDPLTWKETQRFHTGKEPHHLYMTPDEKSLIIANAMAPDERHPTLRKEALKQNHIILFEFKHA